jgi:3D-(3,5/4)-trihydroxycyclohexane-1,2-dione acylhydrolase (decyclizing)
LVTACQENLKITIVISENHGYQSIHGHQKAHVGHSFGNEFRMRNGATKQLDGEYIVCSATITSPL